MLLLALDKTSLESTALWIYLFLQWNKVPLEFERQQNMMSCSIEWIITSWLHNLCSMTLEGHGRWNPVNTFLTLKITHNVHWYFPQIIRALPNRLRSSEFYLIIFIKTILTKIKENSGVRWLHNLFRPTSLSIWTAVTISSWDYHLANATWIFSNSLWFASPVSPIYSSLHLFGLTSSFWKKVFSFFDKF